MNLWTYWTETIVQQSLDLQGMAPKYVEDPELRPVTAQNSLNISCFI